MNPICQQVQYEPKEKTSGPALSLHMSRDICMDPRRSGPFPGPQRSGTIYPDAQLRWSYSASRRPQPPRRRRYENCRLYAGYSLAEWFLRFMSSITQPDHPHVQTLQRPYINAGCFGWWRISRRNNPNNQAAQYGQLRGITKCKSCSYGDPKFSHPQLQLQQIYLDLDLHRKRGSLLITTKNTTH